MRFSRLSAIVLLITMLVTGSGCTKIFNSNADVFETDDKIKLVSQVDGENITYYANGGWNKTFWYGINLGATTPGHSPGELSPSYDDYRRWFNDIEELGIQVIRIYTILPPDFYKALVDHNESAKKKLWFVQGIWPPDEELAKERNSYLPSITQHFDEEISLAILAVYGRGSIKPIPGKASGDYKVNAAPYLLAWMAGGEWDPNMVNDTNHKNPENKQFKGKYFRTTALASPFEAWLAQVLEQLAQEEMKLGWQHPISFVNWVTTDPLRHPDEPLEEEDLVTVDPVHIAPMDDWKAGYFAAYHVYPYYPDSLRYQQNYQNFVNPQGIKDPYEAYLRDLQRHHAGIPLMIAEFGVPSSRGMAHRASLERNQGMHTESEQGQQNIAMFQAMQRVGLTGGILFEWHDEWFKFTWNTIDLELPASRRPLWLNRLTNEENFGLLAVEPGTETKIILDGKRDDWDKIANLTQKRMDDGSLLMATSDEGYLYLAIDKPVDWNWLQDQLIIGFDNQPGGNHTGSNPVITFNQGIEFLLTMNSSQDAKLMVASAYDQHTFLYGFQKKMIPWDSAWEQEDNGIFLPWKLCLSHTLFLPATKQVIPLEEVEIGQLKGGNSNPASPDFNSLTDFYAGKNLLEFRIPWMMLGFTDPSSHQVWFYPYRYKVPQFSSITSPGLNVYAATANKEAPGLVSVQTPLAYKWSNWEEPNSHERKKQSYYLLKDFFEKGQ